MANRYLDPSLMPQPITPTPAPTSDSTSQVGVPPSPWATQPQDIPQQTSFMGKVGEDTRALLDTPGQIIANPTQAIIGTFTGIPESLKEVVDPQFYADHPLIAAINTLSWLSVPFTLGASRVVGSALEGAVDAGMSSALESGVVSTAERTAEGQIAPSFVKKVISKSVNVGMGEALKTGDTTLLKTRLANDLKGFAGFTSEHIDNIVNSVVGNVEGSIKNVGPVFKGIDMAAHPFGTITKPFQWGVNKLLGATENSAVARLFPKSFVNQNLETMTNFENWLKQSLIQKGVEPTVDNMEIQARMLMKGQTPDEFLSEWQKFESNGPLTIRASQILGQPVSAGELLRPNEVSAITRTVNAMGDLTKGKIANLIDELGQVYSIARTQKDELINLIKQNPTTEGVINAINQLKEGTLVPNEIINASSELKNIAQQVENSGKNLVYAPQGKVIYATPEGIVGMTGKKIETEAPISKEIIPISQEMGLKTFSGRFKNIDDFFRQVWKPRYGRQGIQLSRDEFIWVFNELKGIQTPESLESFGTVYKPYGFGALNIGKPLDMILYKQGDEVLVVEIDKNGNITNWVRQHSTVIPQEDVVGKATSLDELKNIISKVQGKTVTKVGDVNIFPVAMKPLDFSYSKSAIGSLFNKMGFSTRNIGNDLLKTLYKDKFNKLAESLRATYGNILQLGNRAVPIENLYNQLDYLKNLTGYKASRGAGKYSIQELTKGDLYKLGIDKNLAGDIVSVIKKSMNLPVEFTGLGSAITNWARAYIPGFNSMLNLTFGGHFRINPEFGARLYLKNELFGQMAGVGKKLTLPQGRMFIDNFTNLIRNIPYVGKIVAPVISDSDIAVYGKYILSKMPSSDIADIMNSQEVIDFKQRYNLRGGLESNNFFQRLIGISAQMQEIDLAKAVAQNYGIKNFADIVGDEAVQKKIVETVDAFYHYRKGFENSPLMRSLNVAFYPIRFEYKVASRTAEWLGKQSPILRQDLMGQMIHSINFMNSPEGKKWAKDNAGILGALNYFLPYQEIGNTIADAVEGKLFQGQSSYIGGLPFGFVMSLAEKLGLIPTTPYANPYTGKVTKTKVIPKQVWSVASAQTALEVLVSHIFPTSLYTLTGGKIFSLTSTYHTSLSNFLGTSKQFKKSPLNYPNIFQAEQRLFPPNYPPTTNQ